MQNKPGTNEPFGNGELRDDELDDVSGGTIQGNLDSMGDMGETESMRLQTYMDRKSKYLETLTNVGKKIGQASDTITQHLK